MKRVPPMLDFHRAPDGGTGRSRCGVALIITLAVVVLFTVLLVAFFSRSILNRQISFSGTNLVKTDILARAALDKIIGEFRQEICDPGHSTATTISGTTASGTTSTTIYTPLASTNAFLIRDPALASEPNLLRISSATPPTGASALAASSVSSSAPSTNSRFISASRWNEVALRTGTISAATTPNWILVTRSGPKSSVALADAGNQSGTNCVIGRYAYAVYDEGSLLDINVAGYPDAAASETAKKGPSSFANLAAAGIAGLTSAWTNWRNLFVASGTSYVNEVLTDATNGFTAVSSTSNTFLSRRDAISFAGANSLSSALPYLGTSLFEKNSPVIASGTDPSLNPDFTKLISPVTGKPLQRFALSRFKLLDQDPSSLSTTDAANILKYFGLVPLSGASGTASATYRAWQYRSSTIGTLADAINSGRDPDLFELLKAAITNGSLGALCSNATQTIYQTGAGVTAYTPEQNVHHQVARIIANMIDQSGTTNYPTTIVLGTDPVGNTVHGIKHLPYFSEMLVKVYYPSGDISNSTNAQGHFYFELWDPHQGSLPTTGPTNVRILPNTEAKFRLQFKRIYYGPSVTTNAIDTGWKSIDSTNGTGVNIGALDKYSSPLIAYTEDSSDPTRRSGMTTGTSGSAANFNSFAFSSLLTSTVIPKTPAGPNGTFYDPAMLTFGVGDIYQPSSKLDGFFIQLFLQQTNFLLQYQDAAGVWRTYSTFAGHENDGGDTGMHQFALLRDSISTLTLPFTRYYSSRIDQPNGSIPKPDPRTFRFRTGVCTGVSQGINTAALLANSPSLSPNAAMVSGTDPGQPVDANTAPSDYGSSICYPGMLYKNNNATYIKLPDPDGTARVADGYLSSATTPANPMASTGTNARPVILNRPFRSVGELGYVFRDVPWKSLNFFSSDSGDAALMELFSMEEGDLVAGKTNLNTPHQKVVTALVQGALRSELDTNSGVAAADASQIASDLVAITGTTPLLDRHELVTKFPAFSGASTGSAYPAIKTQREALVRGLASATQTRTWNLLIDLVAQSGRYPANPSGLDKFTVEGEKHCWMHVAIDRYTGEILRTQMEVADE